MKTMVSKETIGKLPEIMTLTEIAAFLRIRRFRVWHLVHYGKLPSFRVGQAYRVTRADLENFISGGGKT